MNSEETIFEKIIKGEIPCDKVYEDEHVLAFLDAFPGARGHTLVVPKKHSRNFINIQEEEIGPLFEAVNKVSNAVKSAMDAEGVFIAMNNEVGQEVFHTHVHVIPRSKNDGWHMTRKLEYKDGEAAEVAEKIAREIK